MEIDLAKLKLIIWDLDDTFWEGTISEGEVQSNNCKILKTLSDYGIINSICSKNDRAICEKKLKELDVLKYFVFPSIDWTSKASRIRNIINQMGLRPSNCLFVDDNLVNLNEAHYYMPELMTAMPDVLQNLEKKLEGLPPTDEKHTRLYQYKLLEQKSFERQKFNSNEDFLYACRISVEICYDCVSQIDRIAELVLRTNQLNYTKLREGKQDLLNLFQESSSKCGYVTASDKFGTYGVIGFFALVQDNEGHFNCRHFLFSCRTIGQGIQQYVYASLGYPSLEIVGEVVTALTKESAPDWINYNESRKNGKVSHCSDNRVNVLLKGPCDMMAIQNYLGGNIRLTADLTYLSDSGINMEAHNHSTMLLCAANYTEQQKDELLNDCIFIDKKFFEDKIFSDSYHLICLSCLMEPNIGIYRKKNTNLIIPFAQAYYPLTDEKNWEKYISGTIFNAGNKFTVEYLKTFSDKYEFIGRTEPKDYIERLKFVLDKVDKRTVVCVVLGSEMPYENVTSPAYIGREKDNKRFNNEIRQFASTNDRLKIIDVNNFIHSQSDFSDQINHFTPQVYYKIARTIITIINESFDKKEIFVHEKELIVNEIKGFIKKICPQKIVGYADRIMARQKQH